MCLSSAIIIININIVITRTRRIENIKKDGEKARRASKKKNGKRGKEKKRRGKEKKEVEVGSRK